MKRTKYVDSVVCMPPEMIYAALEGNTRQYIQGDLQQPQNLPFIYSSKSEIGISQYLEFSHDDPHYHDVITETNYVICGKVMMRNLDTGEDFIVEAGGVYSVPPKVVHIFKAQPGTRMLFVKDHAVNDKHVVDMEPLHLEQWLTDKEF